MKASISGSEFPNTTEGGSENAETKHIDLQCPECPMEIKVESDAEDIAEYSAIHPVAETFNLKEEPKLLEGTKVNIKQELFELEEFEFAENAPATSDEPFGLAEPHPGRRGRERTRPASAKRKRKSRRTEDEDRGVPVESSLFCENFEMGDVKSDAEDAGTHGTNDPVGFSETFNLKQELIPAEELSREVQTQAEEVGEDRKEDGFKLVEGNEVNIKEETIELGEYQLADYENYSAANGDSVGELKLEDVVSDDPTVEQQVSKAFEDDEVDSDEPDDHTFEPFDKPEQPQITRELVIRLVKLDYSAVTAMARVSQYKNSKVKNPFPRTNCEYCGQVFSFQYWLSMHRIKEHGSKETPIQKRKPVKNTLPRDFRCDQCDKAYHREVRLATHKAKVHGIGEQPTRDATTILTRSCKHCNKKFNIWKSLVYHLKYVHGETIDYSKFHRCASCKAYFTSAEEMAEHVCARQFSVTLDRPYKCNLCEKGFAQRHQMENHFNLHPEYQNVQCDQCPKAFFNEAQVKRHKSRSHKSKEAGVECNICKKLLSSLENLELHLKIHAANRVPYFCEQCGLQYKNRRSYLGHFYYKHKAKPTKAEPNPCSKCGKIYNSKQTLKFHMKTHNRQIKCSFCEKLFATMYAKRTHEQIHTKDYTFKCSVCDYGTVRRNLLMEHEQKKHNLPM